MQLENEDPYNPGTFNYTIEVDGNKYESYEVRSPLNNITFHPNYIENGAKYNMSIVCG